MAVVKTHKNRLYVDDVYDIFKDNRTNSISYIGVKNEYLSYNTNNKYVYAKNSSTNFSNDCKSQAYLKVGNIAYTFFVGHSYTYTEGASADNAKCFLIAHDFYAGNTWNNNSINANPIIIHSAQANYSNISQTTVNVKSNVSYEIVGANDKTLHLDELKLTHGNVEYLLDGNNYLDCETSLSYNYIKQGDTRDGEIHDDGKQRIDSTGFKDIHVWSTTAGINEKPYTYTGPNDTNKVNAYAYINFGDSFKNYCRQQLQNNNTFVAGGNAGILTPYYYDINDSSVVNPNWKGKSNDTGIYVEDSGQDYKSFYINCKADNLQGHTDASFVDVYNHPSWRDNYGLCNFYEKIKIEPNTQDTAIANINSNNYNTTKFVKKISGLPVHMISNNLKFKISCRCGHINGGSIGGGGRIDLNKISISYKTDKTELIEIFNGTISIEITTDSNNNIYPHEISAGESEYLKVVENGIHEVTANEIGGHYGEITEIEGYVIYEFMPDRIYNMFEGSYPNKTIRSLYIEGTNDVVIRPSNTSVEQYISMDSSDFILEGNTNYTGDYRGKIIKTDNTEQLSSEINLNFTLPDN